MQFKEGQRVRIATVEEMFENIDRDYDPSMPSHKVESILSSHVYAGFTPAMDFLQGGIGTLTYVAEDRLDHYYHPEIVKIQFDKKSTRDNAISWTLSTQMIRHYRDIVIDPKDTIFIDKLKGHSGWTKERRLELL